MKVEFTPKEPPSHAEYLVAARVEVDSGHAMKTVEVYWYDEDHLRIRVPNGAPAVLDGVYLEGVGRDVNLKVSKPS